MPVENQITTLGDFLFIVLIVRISRIIWIVKFFEFWILGIFLIPKYRIFNFLNCFKSLPFTIYSFIFETYTERIV